MRVRGSGHRGLWDICATRKHTSGAEIVNRTGGDCQEATLCNDLEGTLLRNDKEVTVGVAEARVPHVSVAGVHMDCVATLRFGAIDIGRNEAAKSIYAAFNASSKACNGSGVGGDKLNNFNNESYDIGDDGVDDDDWNEIKDNNINMVITYADYGQ